MAWSLDNVRKWKAFETQIQNGKNEELLEMDFETKTQSGKDWKLEMGFEQRRENHLIQWSIIDEYSRVSVASRKN